VPVCPEWDAAAARRELRFGEYLARMCRVGGEDEDTAAAADAEGASNSNSSANPPPPRNKSMDVLSASKVVLTVVRKKFARRVAKLEPADPPPIAPPQPPRSPLSQQFQLPLDFFGLRTAMGSAFGVGSGDGGSNVSSVPATTGDTQAVTAGMNDRTMAGCPMMDGSLESYYQYWDETYSNPHNSAFLASMGALGAGSLGEGAGNNEQLQHGAQVNDNLWNMMTMGWSQNNMNFGGL
jgi:hypothetical protein